ncbi:MAG: hemolysin family protein [Bacteroidetes bacterium]|nr:hemolysin family protein [Bacteroidota bacterium]
MDYDSWLVIIISLAFSAFFSGMEIAFVSANKLIIELENKQGDFTARILSSFIRRPKKFIGAMLIGNNIALVFYGIKAGELVANLVFGVGDWDEYHLPYIALLSQTLITTVVILFTAEFLPKSIFRLNPNRWLSIFALPLAILFYILYIPSWIITNISKIFIKYVLRAETENEEVVFGTVDLDHFLREASENMQDNEDTEHEIQILQNALDLRETKARDCMIPRNEIEALELNESIDTLKERFIETGYSKIVIYRDSIDNIIGYCHSYDLFKTPDDIKNILLPTFIVAEPAPANRVLEDFIAKKRNLAVVVDEFGGTSGIITIEDIVEELFGEIEDEHDKEEMVEKQIAPDFFQFSARLEIDYINERYRLGLPESDEYDTLGGLIIHHAEDIPDPGTQISVGQFAFKILEVDNARIELVDLHVHHVD